MKKKPIESKTVTTITPANIYMVEKNTPASHDYGDVYFFATNGAQETDYVFIDGNDLVNRWQRHNNDFFCIAETGFGTGLNFFRTVQYFQHFRQSYPHHPLTKLVFISTEIHPLHKKDAESILEGWKKDNFLTSVSTNPASYIDLSKIWIEQYPIPVAGIHRRHFSLNNEYCKGQIVLDLHYGDATDAFAQIQKQPLGLVDAWFLDGFTPSKNSSIWTQALYEQMARLSKSTCTFATFTSAGEVKRGLQSAGFNVSKQKAFGHKREMLLGTFNDNLQAMEYTHKGDTLEKQSPKSYKLEAPYFVRSGIKSVNNRQITVVGNGLAGAIMALKLTQRGKHVNLLWQGDLPSDSASGNPIGGFYPQLNAQNNAASQIQLHSFLYASEFYKTLNAAQPFSHAWCAALQLAFNDNTQARLSKLANAKLWPKEVAHFVNSEQATNIANIPIPYACLHIPNAGWIKPPSVVQACLTLAQASGLLTLQNKTQLVSYKCTDTQGIQLTLKTSNGDFAHNAIRGIPTNIADTKPAQSKHVHNTPTLVLAMGSGSESMTKHVIPLRLTRGQVEMVSNDYPASTNSVLARLQTLLCHKGYFTPAADGFHALGSTYIKNDTNCDLRDEETNMNFAMHIQSIQHESWQNELQQARLNPNNYARAAVRCSSPDHLPVVGAMPNESQFKELAELYKALPLHRYPIPSNDANVFVLTGLGSRGLTTAPLMAEILVSQMLDEPMPLAKHLLDTVNPNRFIVRSLIRREPWPA
ncbi:MAG: tRNA 5-methylaminomethyl-2-thiouridine biosynthesis bifunctional protein [Kangiellaceae bacterium]